MQRSPELMTLAAALAVAVFTGCGNPQTGDSEHPGSYEGLNNSGQSDETEAPKPLTELESLPKDFGLEYTIRTAGVLPSDEEFIMVQPDKSGGFLLTAGAVTYENGTRTMIPSLKSRLTEEQCLEFYNKARKAGFFGLRDNYEEMETGGFGKTIKITANGSTKTVHVYGTQVREFDVVVPAIQALLR